MEDDGEGKLIVEDEVKGEVREASENSEAPQLCPRLMVARKSLTRCRSVEESFEGEHDPCLPKGPDGEYENESFEAPPRPGSLNASRSPDSLRPSRDATSPRASQGEAENLTPRSPATPRTDKGSSCRSSTSTTTGPAGSGHDDADGFDDVSASMSVIRMEKFALEKRRVSRILPKCLHRTFVDKDVEQLFQAYHERQRRSDLHILLAAGVTFTLLWLILLHFMLFVGLPLRLPACLLLTILTASAHLTSSFLLVPEPHHLTLQHPSI